MSNIGEGTSGKILQAQGTDNPKYSTATYPATAGSAGKVLISDGTNIVSSTPTYPNTAGSSGVFIRSDGTNFVTSTLSAFAAFLATSDADATGDATTFTIGSGNALTEIFDLGSNFVTTGTFTAPVTGKYQVNACVLAQEVAAVNTSRLIINSSNRLWNFGNTGTSLVGNFPLNMSALIDMDASDTFIVSLQISGGTKTVDVFGAATNPRTFITCQLMVES